MGFSEVLNKNGLNLYELEEGPLRQSIILFEGDWLMFITRPIALKIIVLYITKSAIHVHM